MDKLRDELAVLTKSEVSVNVEEIKRPEIDARLVAENVAHQIRQRISFRRAMKRAVQSAIRTGAEGNQDPVCWATWVGQKSPGPRDTTRGEFPSTPSGPISITPLSRPSPRTERLV